MDQHDVTMCLAIKAAVTESIENMVFMAIDTDTRRRVRRFRQ